MGEFIFEIIAERLRCLTLSLFDAKFRYGRMKDLLEIDQLERFFFNWSASQKTSTIYFAARSLYLKSTIYFVFLPCLCHAYV